MPTFVLRLIAPRPNFAQTLTDSEREIMNRHAAHWRPYLERGDIVVSRHCASSLRKTRAEPQTLSSSGWPQVTFVALTGVARSRRGGWSPSPITASD